ncbi:hypothetical protein ASF83_00460 [Plantibacter sp. Leaf171]|nr:hypothetical protein ASE44_00475 [Plantibacter sp. Leaf1]KQR60420.1 hypothetical protein ASF83_00460 [Plantibacter sp. Leaf171]
MVTHVQGKLGQVAVSGPWERIIGFTSHGLTLFFALSGFLLFRPFAAALINGTARPATGKYAINRLLRIYPGYIVILVLVSFVIGAANTQAPTWGDDGFGRTDASIGFLHDPAGFIASLLMVQTMFPDTNRLGIGVAWSLSVELTFYILLPLLALLAGSIRNRWNRTLLALASAPLLLIGLGVCGKVVSAMIAKSYPERLHFALEWGDNWISVFNRSILVHADLFAYGMIAAVIVVLAQTKKIRPETIRVIVRVSIGVSVSFALIGFSGLGRFLTDSLVGVACGALLLVVVLPNGRGQHSAVSRALELTPFRYTGLVSYSFYLWHVPVIWLLSDRGLVLPDTPLGLVGNCVIVFLVSMALATATYYLVEAPALRLKKSTRAPIVPSAR